MEVVEQFITNYLAPSSIHLVSIVPDGAAGSVTGRHFGTDAAAATQWAKSENHAGKNVYYSVNNVRPGVHKKATKEDIVSIRCAYVDLDPSQAYQWDKPAVLADLLHRGKPSVVVNSGRGIQALWWLNEAVTNDEVESLTRGIRDAFKGDKSVWNCDRVLRLPGLISYMDRKKRTAGYADCPTDIIQPFNGATYSRNVLATAFPELTKHEETIVESFEDRPNEAWCGPEDDEELLQIMLRGGSMSALFGAKATFANLYYAEVEALSVFFPSDNGAPFDHSAADASLLSALAFYTGGHYSRMMRIFSKSGLVRDKWNTRESYRSISINKAIGACKKFYNQPRYAALTQQSETTLPGMEILPSEYMTIHEQQNYFKGCCYVMNEHKVLIPTGDMLKPEQFKAMYGGHVFVISDADGSGATEKNAFTAFTENRIQKFPKVTRTTFKPTLPFGTIVKDAVNTFLPDPDVEAEEGDVTPMLNHVAKLLPNPRDQEIFWTFCASMAQNIGQKFQWALFIQGAEGNGKSLLSEMMRNVVGLRYYHKPFPDDISNKFNDFMHRKLFIDVQEITLEDRHAVMENLKEWITADLIEVQPKGGAKIMIDNHANWIFTSNHKQAMPITANQRRICPLFTAQQSRGDVERDFPQGYFPSLWKWFREGGSRYLVHYLRTRYIDPEFDPAGHGPARARAPESSSTLEAIAASRGRFEQEILENIEAGEVGFRGGWISLGMLKKVEESCRVKLTSIRRKEALESLGYIEYGRSSMVIQVEGTGRPVLYYKREMAKHNLTALDYQRAQGYMV